MDEGQECMWHGVMGSFLLTLGLLLVVAVGGVAGDVQQTPVAESLHDADGEVEMIVSFAESDTATTPAALQAHADETQQPLVEFADEQVGVEVATQFWITNAALVTVDTDRVPVREVAAVDGVESITENAEFEIHEGSGSAPADDLGATDEEYTYGLEQINAPAAWEVHDTQGEGASVAVLDTGVDDDHPDLTVDEWAHFDEDGDPVDSEPHDDNGHGTHVAGTVVGPTDPAGDVPGYGVAPAADLHGVKVWDDTGGGTFARLIAGMEWAVGENVDVISMSLGAQGTTGFFDEMIDPVRNAHDAGTVVVASTGNSGEGSSASPANVYDAISVGASNETEGIAGFSSGEVIDTDSAWNDPPSDWPDEYTVPSVAAPGVDVLSSVPGGYDTRSGTSMAAPHVSGAVALAVSASDEPLSPGSIEEGLEATAFKPGDAPAPPGERDTRYGSGIIDADAFVSFVDDGDGPLLTVSASAPDVVEIDEDLEVDYQVENLGDETGDDFVDLFVDAEDDSVDFDNIEVDPDETVDGTLTFEEVAELYEQGETIEWSVELSAFDDVADGETEIAGEPPGEAEFQIQNVDLTTPVAGEDLDALVTVENVGDDADTQTVELDVEGLGADATDLELDAGETGEAELAVGTEVGDDGEYDATVTTEDDEASAPVLVLAPAEFSVEVLDHTDAVVTGDPVEVTAEIENVGDIEDTQTVELDIEGLGSDAAEVELPFGESTEETFSVDTEADDAGEYEAAVASEDDSDSVEVAVLEPALFAVDIVETNEPVEGEDLDVTVAVENTGDVEDTQTVELDIEGLGDDQVELSLESGESVTETLSVGTEAGDAGEYEAAVTSEDDTDTAVVEVVADTEFLVVDIETNAPIIEGEDIDVTATVENAGGLGTGTVTASIEGIDEDSETVDLDAGATAEVEFTLETEIEDVGEYDLVVATEDDEATEFVELQLPTLPNQDAPPNDLTGDGEFEDVRDTGTFDIFDVQVFFNYHQAPEVQNHVHAYDFNDDGQVTIFDVQALFQKLAGFDQTADTSATRDSPESVSTEGLAVA